MALRQRHVWPLLAVTWCWVAAAGRRDQRGEITEKTIITASFALASVFICALIIYKLRQTASSITSTPPSDIGATPP
ncbi:MAG: hypothetical protein ACRD0D_09360 [Acidimicrobiales bacterium]